MKAWNLTRSAAHYRHDIFSAGLRKAGFDVRPGEPATGEIKPGDVVLGWNRHGAVHEIASRVEAAGGIYICAENGYLGDPETYAMAIHAHNGRGGVWQGGPERWNALGIVLQPWRRTGNHVLVCPNRPFGMPGSIMPPYWADEVRGRLQRLTNREIRVRYHPAPNVAPQRPLAEDLADCWATVIWSSSVGVQSLIAGVPVLCDAPYWICKQATGAVDEVEDPPKLDRLRAMRRLAWGQFKVAEIESGYAFRHLLRNSG